MAAGKYEDATTARCMLWPATMEHWLVWSRLGEWIGSRKLARWKNLHGCKNAGSVRRAHCRYLGLHLFVAGREHSGVGGRRFLTTSLWAHRSAYLPLSSQKRPPGFSGRKLGLRSGQAAERKQPKDPSCCYASVGFIAILVVPFLQTINSIVGRVIFFTIINGGTRLVAIGFCLLHCARRIRCDNDYRESLQKSEGHLCRNCMRWCHFVLPGAIVPYWHAAYALTRA